MISIIVCSVNNSLFKQFESSVNETIGAEFEIIKIDNKNNRYSICEAYNTGAISARFNHICFAHEDIVFRSNNWGTILKDAFENNHNIGIIGIAGSKYKSLAPSGWPSGHPNADCYNLIQQNKNDRLLQIFNRENKDTMAEVKVLDGAFLFTTKQIWAYNKFDEKTFTGFHGYDLDFCLQVGKNHKLIVCFELLIEHLSTGSENKDWLINSILLSKKWKDHLPIGNLSYQDKLSVEWYQKRLFALKMRIHGFSLFKITAIFLKFGYMRFFNLDGNISFLKEIIRATVKRSLA